MIKHHLFKGLVGVLLVLVFSVDAEAQQSWNLSRAARWISQETEYRFLYRETFASQFMVPKMDSPQVQLELILKELPRLGVEVLLDTAYKHILIFERNDNKTPYREFIFTVVDDLSSERLAYVPAKVEGQTHYADEAGRLSISLEVQSKSDEIQFSYLGYEPINLKLPKNRGLYYFSIRLKPDPIWGDEVIVEDKKEIHTSFILNELDAPFAAGGEFSYIRSSQSLPSVLTQAALDQDFIIRGSTPDGVLVQFDGVTSFENNHLFGLVDNYNADVLQLGGLFIDKIPARFQATSGGVMDLRTRSGNRNESETSIGLSTSAIRIHAEGGLPGGAGSWLLGGKQSLMNQFTGLGNTDRIAWGLDTGREISIQDSRFTPASTELYVSDESDVQFSDIHGKIALETENGSTIQITGYLGGDDITQNGRRYYQTSSSIQFDDRFALQPVQTANSWEHAHTGISVWSEWGNWVTQLTAHYSYFTTQFSKDDYTYLNPTPQDDALRRAFIDSYSSENEISEAKMQFSAEQHLSPFQHVELGLSTANYAMSYEEESFSYPLFSAFYTSWLIEPFVQWDWDFHPKWSLFTAVRGHYFSDGNYARVSPRVEMDFRYTNKSGIRVGYNRGFQFLNRLSLYNTVTSDVWIPATAGQKPLSTDYVYGEHRLSLFGSLEVKTTVYAKWLNHVRMHEINTRNYATSFNPEPWFTNHSLTTQGLEQSFLFEGVHKTAMISYTWSKSDLQNDEINNGDAFPAYWDRRHQIKLNWKHHFAENWRYSLSGLIASGLPARVPGSVGITPERLDWYKRLDVGLSYFKKTNLFNYEVKLSVYNVLNFKNPWYREEIQAFDSLENNAELVTVQADVLDLRVLPSLDIRISW
ncbi:hypothetical protein EP331_12380 [bacterium]|nr:MAG: hypothetical protein EP331_12380 [bacterium]